MKRLIIALFSLSLAACATHPNLTNTQTGQIQTGCVGNPYMEKYNCSIDQIQQAAETGDPDAQYALGYMYFYGIGTIQDEQTAMLWIKRAAAQGQPLAKKAALMMDNKNKTSSQPTRYHVAKVSKPSIKSKYNTALHDPRLNPGSSPITNIPNVAVTSSNHINQQTTNNQIAPSGIFNKSPHAYTIQLMGTHDLKSIAKFITEYKLSKQVSYYKTSFHGLPWYPVIYGTYNSAHAAHNAIKQLPMNLQKLGPWIKSYAVVQQEVKTKHI